MSAEAKVAYLKGLIDGCNLAKGDKDKEKFLTALVDALEEITREIKNLDSDLDETNKFADDIFEDVLNLKYGTDSDDDDCDCGDCHCKDDDDCEDCDGCPYDCEECDHKDECAGCDGCEKGKLEDSETFDQIVCPHCEEKFYFDASAYEDGDELICPYCGKTSTYNA